MTDVPDLPDLMTWIRQRHQALVYADHLYGNQGARGSLMLLTRSPGWPEYAAGDVWRLVWQRTLWQS